MIYFPAITITGFIISDGRQGSEELAKMDDESKEAHFPPAMSKTSN